MVHFSQVIASATGLRKEIIFSNKGKINLKGRKSQRNNIVEPVNSPLSTHTQKYVKEKKKKKEIIDWKHVRHPRHKNRLKLTECPKHFQRMKMSYLSIYVIGCSRMQSTGCSKWLTMAQWPAISSILALILFPIVLCMYLWVYYCL